MSTMCQGALLCTKCDNALRKRGTLGEPSNAAQPPNTACAATILCCLPANCPQPFFSITFTSKTTDGSKCITHKARICLLLYSNT